MISDIFESEAFQADYQREMDEHAAMLKYEFMQRTEGALAYWLLGRSVKDIPEAADIISFATTNVFRIRFEYGQNCDTRDLLLVRLLSQSPPYIWSDQHDRITHIGADILEFLLTNYQDISLKCGDDIALTLFFETCAAMEERIVDLLVAESFEEH